jgi:transcriptional regulator with XRE-family HTH domain
MKMIGERLRTIRKDKKMSQGELEKRTGLLRCYISRIENGHTTPSLETLEKLASALGIPLYQIFYDGDAPPKMANFLKKKDAADEWGLFGKWAAFLRRLQSLLGQMEEGDRKLLLGVAFRLARKK